MSNFKVLKKLIDEDNVVIIAKNKGSRRGKYAVSVSMDDVEHLDVDTIVTSYTFSTGLEKLEDAIIDKAFEEVA